MSSFRVIQKPAPTLDECRFYHVVDLPTGTTGGEWDLRPTVDRYLGQVDFKDKSVLEIGPASGFISFHLEKAGATVTALEPAIEQLWDIVPMPDFDTAKWRRTFLGHIVGVRASFWYLHHLYRSQVKLIEAVPDAIPAEVGEFDIGVLAAVLLHTRAPFNILESTARRVRKTIIVTELYDASLGERPVCSLLPYAGAGIVDTWWAFSPNFFVQALGLLGFHDATVTTHHHQHTDGRVVPMYTVVAHRR
jgi:O-methyltransferase